MTNTTYTSPIAGAEPAPKRGRGRPPGSKNKLKTPEEILAGRTALPPIGVPEKEGCRLLGVGSTTLKKLAREGAVEVYHDGRRKRYVYQSLVDYARRMVERTKADAAERAAQRERLYPNLTPGRRASHPGGDT